MGKINRAAAEVVREAIDSARPRVTQRAVADEARISASTWRRRMTGATAFRVDEFVIIAHLLGKNPGELLDQIGRESA
uniref:helix-turn-helix domain-containing protein n=1 Tax=Nocardia suismassiliense TaxID=2077092 RepID=UPI003F4925FC